MPSFSRLTLISLLGLSLAGPLSAKEKHTDAAARAYDSLYTQFMALSPAGMKSAEVHNLALTRDGATFLLRNGRIFRCNPIGGRTCAVVFRGTGLFTMRPPGSVEQQQLSRFLEKDSLAEPFTDLAMLFADSTAEELTGRCLFTSFEPDDPDAAGFLRSSVKLMSDEDTDGFDGAFLSTFLEGKRNDLFMAQFTGPDIPVYCFRIDPTQEEEVSFARKKSGLLHSYFEIINQFNRQTTSGAASAAHAEGVPLIAISDYLIDVTVADNLDFRASARLTFTSRHDGYRWVPLGLFSKLRIDSVLWRPGIPAEYHRDDKQSTLWIRCPAPLTKGEVCSLQVCYQGDLLRKDELDWIEIGSSSGWYPRYGYQPARFDLTYHIPAKYQFSSVGERVSLDVGEEGTTSHWITRVPTGNASFNLGFFKESTVNDKRIPPVVVQMAQTGHRTLASAGFSSGSAMDEQVSADVANSITFFQNVYGKCPVDNLYATEIPWMHGEAFPGLIHLSWTTFQRTDESGSDEVFRAHEVAHQWWGLGVGFRTYHDQWLSEAFATYSGLWYMQAALHDNKRFFDMLESYKERILSNRHYLIGKGQEAGPIWLGVRTHSSETAGDYDLIIYRKGAWVLHMLRNMLIDLKTMNEDRFQRMMRDYYTTYAGKKASTDDFARLASKHFDQDMGWFFKEWIYETGIPRYRFAWKAEETPEGRYRVTCRVEQEEVPEDFKMPVPLLIKFEGDRFARLRVTVTGRRMVFDLPPMPLKPEEIEFNDLHSVLCEVKTESWD